MKLGTKIALGFGSVLAIAVALGSLAVWNMNGVKATATVLANENVPSVLVATDVERDSLQTMYATRGYAYTEDLLHFLSLMSRYVQEQHHLQGRQPLLPL